MSVLSQLTEYMVEKLIGTHYLYVVRNLCKNVVPPHHVCIVFSLSQPITMFVLNTANKSRQLLLTVYQPIVKVTVG